MSYGTSDSTVISPITTEAHNLSTTIASAAQRDDGSPATIPTTSPKNRHIVIVSVEHQINIDLNADRIQLE